MNRLPVLRSKLIRHGLRMPQAQTESAPAAADEGVVGGDAVARAAYAVSRAVHVDPEDLPEQGVLVLAVVVGIVGATAVADAEVQVPVGAERHRPTIVIRIRAVLDDQDRCQGVDAGERARRVRRHPRDHDVATRTGVVDVEQPICRELRVERQPEEALLTA